jgi:carboxypeptidase PM20D1
MAYFGIFAAIVVALAAVLLFRTARFKPRTTAMAGQTMILPADPDLVARKLAAAVRIPTISFPVPDAEREKAMLDLHAELERLFPKVHSAMEREVINGFSLVFHWKGKSSREPGLVMAHMDVVPVEPGTEKDWAHEPFSGAIADGFVWGRGSMDIKSHMICSLEAAEQMIFEGIVPERDIWFAFGHDEEIGGKGGASRIVEWFSARKVHFSWLVDEGGLVSDGVIKGVGKPLALIGVGEKGFANIRFTARDKGGHASMPPPHSALGNMATFLHRLERSPMKARMIPPVRTFLDGIGREMSFGLRVILSNLWLFEALFIKVFSANRAGNAMLRTTIAVTMAEASSAPNVLPQRAQAVANFRLLPGDTGDTLMSHLKKVAKGMDIEMEVLQLDNPSSLSDYGHPAFRRIAEAASSLYPEAVVVPYLVMAATDARKYESVADNQYRFTPYRIDESDLKRIHGTNERISADNLNRCVAFFRFMMEG